MFERGARAPALAQCGDVCTTGLDLFPSRLQQLKHAHLHGVVLQQGLRHDPLTQREDRVAVVQRAFTRRCRAGSNRTDRGANPDGVRHVALSHRVELRAARYHGALSAIEER